jgi:hypothetical protein
MATSRDDVYTLTLIATHFRALMVIMAAEDLDVVSANAINAYLSANIDVKHVFHVRPLKKQ